MRALASAGLSVRNGTYLGRVQIDGREVDYRRSLSVRWFSPISGVGQFEV